MCKHRFLLMTEPNGKSNSLTYRWLTGILVGIVLTMSAFIINNLYLEVGSIKVEHVDGRQRIQALETINVDVQRRLTRIESKLDKLLEK